MMFMAERFLVRCLTNNRSIFTFDDLRFEKFHQKSSSFDIEHLPPTSSSIRYHVLRAYLQSYLWYHAPFDNTVDLIPESYGYRRDDDDNQLIPVIIDELNVPECFPIPCTCIKCARERICPCRVKKIACCEYCKCGSSSICKNVYNEQT